MYDLGDTIGLAVSVRDAAGALVNATGATLTITKPDGTTAAGITVTNPPAQTGQYVYDYVAADVGRFAVRWVFTNPNAAFTDVFDVRPAAPDYLVSMADAKATLNIPASSTTDDEELRRHIEAATAYIESRVGPVVRRTYTDYVEPPWWSNDSNLATIHRQVLSVTSVTTLIDNVSWTSGQLANIDVQGERGILRLKNGGLWPFTVFKVVYVCGRPVMPANVALAADLLIKWSWETQRGSALTPLSSAETATGLSPYTGMVPVRVDSLLSASADRTGFA